MRALIGLVLLALGFLGGIFATYFKAYSAKKGENLATHEDINKVLDEVRAVTTTTREIEAKISGDLWNRQKEWELKRDVLFAAAKRLPEISNELIELDTFHKVDKREMSEESWTTLQNKYISNWRTAIKAFEEVCSLIQISCSRETMIAFSELANLLRSSAANIVNGDGKIYESTAKERARMLATAKTAIRQELGIKLDPTHQSNGSSASQALAARAPG